MNYIVISHFDLDKFMKKVNDCLEAGWKCQGGIGSYKEDGYEMQYTQALVKEDDE